jgi:hypothetical protein
MGVFAIIVSLSPQKHVYSILTEAHHLNATHNLPHCSTNVTAVAFAYLLLALHSEAKHLSLEVMIPVNSA